MEDENENSTSVEDIFVITLFFTAVFLAQNVLSKLCKHTLYDIDLISMKDSFKSIVTVFLYSIYSIIIILIIMKYEYLRHMFEKLNLLTCTPWILFSWMFSKFINCIKWKDSCTTTNMLWGLDYGTGMAYNYYYGYLRLILPSLGTANKGLLEKIENIEDSHNISIAVHKLFILIPSSSYIPPDLKEASYQWMENAIELEDEIRDRAGVKRRIYRNNVYKIYPDGKKSNSVPVYVVAEGATPLLTFYEVLKHAHRETNMYQKYHKNIIENFRNKLKELLNDDPECRDLCELIYYHDIDTTGAKTNVAKVILERLYEITNLK